MESFSRLFRDFRYAFRSLRGSPGMATAAIATLALGIGANAAIFSVLEGVVLEPLPFKQPDRLVVVALFNRTLGYATYLSYPDFLDWRQNASSFEQIAAFANDGFDLTAPGVPEHLDCKEVSANFFSTLGAQLAFGRAFSPEEDKMGGAPAAVISSRIARERFGSQAPLGKTLTLNGVNYTVVGVLKPGFRFDEKQADVYTPLARKTPMYINDRTVHDILCIARLRREVGVGQALAEMNTVQEHIDELHPTTERGLGASVVPLKQILIGDIGGTLLLLLGAVGLVLLIACVNVANLMLARSAGRMREYAIRLALGASRKQIAWHAVTEGMLLSVAGASLGLIVAKCSVSVVLAVAPGTVPRSENIGLNTPVILFALVMSLGAGCLFGLFPALHSARANVQAVLKGGGRGLAAGNQPMQRILVVFEVAAALVLLNGAGLLIRTIRNLWSVNPGFSPQNVVTFQVGLPREATLAPEGIRIAYQQLMERVRQVPGVAAADITALVPLGGGANEGPFWVGPQQPASMAEIPRAVYYPIGPDYLSAMEIPLLRGRLLGHADNRNSSLVVLVDSLLARRFFPGQNALGQAITIPHWGADKNVRAEIVGIVGHVEHYGLDGSVGEKPQIYFSMYQLPDDAMPVFRSEIAVVVRAQASSAGVMPAIRNAIDEADGHQPIYNVRTMPELVSRSMGRQRFPMLLLVAFAVLALALAFVGIYGVISYSTARRVNEIGIRMALGATKYDILRMVAGQGLGLAAAGVGIGVAGTLVLIRMVSLFSRLLYGVRAGDPTMLLAVSAILIGAAVLASYIPARRAATLEPTDCLRQE
ncbi:MAG TPA: ABC transporter permease [Bryobacteraceae bacterium]|nr:ABC transporter permease [Bryobacteraceae bacterium]